MLPTSSQYWYQVNLPPRCRLRYQKEVKLLQQATIQAGSGRPSYYLAVGRPCDRIGCRGRILVLSANWVNRAILTGLTFFSRAFAPGQRTKIRSRPVVGTRAKSSLAATGIAVCFFTAVTHPWASLVQLSCCARRVPSRA